MKKILGFLFCLAALANGYGQLSIKVGYIGSYSKFDGVNQFFDQLNTASDKELIEPFTKQRFLNGLDLGLRYHFVDNFALEAGWDLGQSGLISQRALNSAGTEVLDKWKLQNTSIYAGFLNQFGWIGYGASFHRNTFSLSNDFSNSRKYKRIDESNFWSTKIFISIEHKSKHTAFALRPFYNLAFKPYKFDKLVTPGGQPQSFGEKLNSFGISMVIYNGK